MHFCLICRFGISFLLFFNRSLFESTSFRVRAFVPSIRYVYMYVNSSCWNQLAISVEITNQLTTHRYYSQLIIILFIYQWKTSAKLYKWILAKYQMDLTSSSKYIVCERENEKKSSTSLYECFDGFQSIQMSANQRKFLCRLWKSLWQSESVCINDIYHLWVYNILVAAAFGNNGKQKSCTWSHDWKIDIYIFCSRASDTNGGDGERKPFQFAIETELTFNV